MTATKFHIEQWLERAKELEATHVIIAVDRYNNENFPVYIGAHEDIEEEVENIQSQNMQGIDEIYNMSMDIDKQLAQYRAWNV